MDYDLKHIQHSFSQQDKVDQVKVTKGGAIFYLYIHKIFLSPVFFLLFYLRAFLELHCTLELCLHLSKKHHRQFALEDLFQFLQPAISGKGKVETRADAFIEELKGKIFPSSDAETVQKYKNDVEALEYGIESEKRSINFLTQLLDKEKKLDVKTIFSHLIVEEKKHLALLEGLREKI